MEEYALKVPREFNLSLHCFGFILDLHEAEIELGLQYHKEGRL
jgi:hypothetical protein